MERPIHITAVPKDPVDLDQFVAALLALALARHTEEKEAEASEKEREDEQ